MQITIHDGFDVNNKSIVHGRCTKQWKWDYWNKLVRLIKNSCDATIIQLGAVTGREIDGVDQCLLNKTTILEAIKILEKSKFHIDGDSGLVHVATKLGIPCIVLFGPTPDYFYGYKKNVNIRSNVCKEACFWIKDNWMDKCPLGYATPKCLDAITADDVFEKIRKKGLL